MKSLFLFFAFFLSTNVWANGTATACPDLSTYSEKKLAHFFLTQKEEHVAQCIADDPNRDEVAKITRILYPLISQMNGLPDSFQKKWRDLTWSQTYSFTVSQKLCLDGTDTCPESSELVAKNYHRGHFGIILINSNQWQKLSLSGKTSVIWHEILSILDYEANSYEYSSMVEFELEEVSIQTEHGYRLQQTLVAHLLDPTFIRR